MAVTLAVPLRQNDILMDALEIMNMPFPSGVSAADALSISDYEDDLQFTLLYDMLIAVHGRDILMRLEPVVGQLKAKVVGTRREDTSWSVEIEFDSHAEAMLFKLAHAPAS